MLFPFIILGVLAVSLLLNGLACWRGYLFVKNQKKAARLPSALPPVTLMVPVCGVEKDGVKHFERFTQFNWSEYQLIFTVLDEDDPAIQQLIEIRSSKVCKVEIQVGGGATGANLKIRNLQNALPRARYPWLIICDADVIADPQLIRGIMEPFLLESESELKVGLVHSLYRCRTESSWASAWENIWINCDFWVQGLLGEWIRGVDFAFGAAMAIHRNTLDELGGLEILKDFLADDYQLGNRVVQTEKRIVFNRSWVTLEEGANQAGEVWKHLLRWARTLRVCNPGGFGGSLILNVTLIAVAGTLLFPSFIWKAAILAIFVRIGMANLARNMILGTRGIWKWIWLVPFKDLAHFVIWILAFANQEVVWRGHHFHLHEDGRLMPITPEEK